MKPNYVIYSSNEVQQACDRFREVTKQGTQEFLVWIGYDHPFAEDIEKIFPLQLMMSPGMVTDTKMQLILSTHWVALLKASLIREGTHGG